jgi:pilus assembly protein Flp/PilA
MTPQKIVYYDILYQNINKLNKGVKMKKLFSWLKNEESGQGMVEYGLILALIAVVVIAAVKLIGDNAKGTFEEIAGELEGTTTP